MASASIEGTRGQLQPVRILYKEMMAGDRLKVEARSNKSASGGGARDFRFNHEAFGPVFAKMFPKRKTETRKREDEKRKIELYEGRLCWTVDPARPDKVMSTSILYEPPTTSRATEGRIATVHKYAPFRQYPADAIERVFLLLVEDENHGVWAFYVTESSLRTDVEWDPAVVKPILECIKETHDSKAVLGWIDLTTPSHYCHGRKRAQRPR